MKLHEDRELFISAVSSVAQSMNLPEVYIEKDYWVTRTLKQLSESYIVEKIVFKGGTSLSKAHGLIHRFSEDIDLAVIATGSGDAERKKLLKTADAIVSNGLTPLPDDDRNSKGSKFRKTVYQYPRTGDEAYFSKRENKRPRYSPRPVADRESPVRCVDYRLSGEYFQPLAERKTKDQ